MKKLLSLIALLLLGVVLFIGGALLLSDSPMKTLESFAMRHADKLPLAYLGEKLFDKPGVATKIILSIDSTGVCKVNRMPHTNQSKSTFNAEDKHEWDKQKGDQAINPKAQF